VYAAITAEPIVVEDVLRRVGDPADGAVLLFAGEDRSVAEEFARADPYVTSGIVARWQVREWTTVVGEKAATPVRPAEA
jgi:hypothetical protein